MNDKKYIALSGGVGGAKLVYGLTQNLAPEQLLTVANTGDDFQHLGLHISPDLDSVMYALAGINDMDRGWGVTDESWNFLASIKRMGGPDWFQLGDRDMATHVLRTQYLREENLTAATQRLCQSLGVKYPLVPMSEQSVQTRLTTDVGNLSFQEYFVARQCEPVVSAIDFVGADQATIQPELSHWLTDTDLAGIIICPSNPYLSIDPILAIPSLVNRLRDSGVPIIAVSPIIAGKTIKGPAAKIMQEMGLESSVLNIARHYVVNGQPLLHTLVVDVSDEMHIPEIEALGVRCVAMPTIMQYNVDKNALAKALLSQF